MVIVIKGKAVTHAVSRRVRSPRRGFPSIQLRCGNGLGQQLINTSNIRPEDMRPGVEADVTCRRCQAIAGTGQIASRGKVGAARKEVV
jgi:hypothetical protein